MRTGVCTALGAALAVCLLLGGCASYQLPSFGFSSAPLQVKGKFKPAHVSPVDTRDPVYVSVEPYRDHRGDAPPRQIGTTKDAHVSDLQGSKIAVDEDVAALVTAAMKSQLKEGGYRVSSDGDAGAGHAAYVLGGRVDAFRYDVHSRDKMDLQVHSVLRAPGGKEVLWEGTVKERTERFAGVSGDNRATVVHFLNQGLQNVTRKTLVAVNGALSRAHPDLFLQGGAPVPGVQVQVAPHAAPAASGAAQKQGVLAVETAPEAVKVYIGDVFYGITPLKLHLAPGIYNVRLVAEGYREVRQKVSVRTGETTTWKTTLTK